MSEEEKKAIEWLKNTSLDELEYENDMKSIDIVLNLVENLQKEIEELKKPKYLVHFENNKITKMELINDYISKDKIREIIAEYKKQLQSADTERTAIMLSNFIMVLNDLLEEK